MKKRLLALALILSAFAPVFGQQDKTTKSEKDMNRIELAKKNYAQLFKGEALTDEGTDPEIMQILQKYIFGEVFQVGNLDIKIRELITCVNLAAMQQLPQLKGHVGAALNVGATPIEIREAIYQSATLIGFPKVLNAMTAANEAFKERGIKVPLEKTATVTEENRYEKGMAIQKPLYGNRMKEALKDVPGGMGADVARFLTEVHFGDFYTRDGLDLKTRELLNYAVLTVIGTEDQLHSHLLANIKAGNSKETITATVIQCLPYIGFPAAIKALKIVKDTPEPATAK